MRAHAVTGKQAFPPDSSPVRQVDGTPSSASGVEQGRNRFSGRPAYSSRGTSASPPARSLVGAAERCVLSARLTSGATTARSTTPRPSGAASRQSRATTQQTHPAQRRTNDATAVLIPAYSLARRPSGSIGDRFFAANSASWLVRKPRVLKVRRDQAVERDLDQQIGVELGEDRQGVARAFWSDLPLPQPRDQRMKVPEATSSVTRSSVARSSGERSAANSSSSKIDS